jgi:hypothetical protein
MENYTSFDEKSFERKKQLVSGKTSFISERFMKNFVLMEKIHYEKFPFLWENNTMKKYHF